MPKFFFDTADNGVSAPDNEGSELESAEAARRVALEVLPELISHRSLSRDQSICAVTVRDQAGRCIYRATLTVTGEWLEDGATPST